MLIQVKVYPEARKEKVVEKEPGHFEIYVKEEPVGNRANDAAKRILGDYFNLSEDRVRLVRGFHERSKIFDIAIERSQKNSE